MYSKTSIFIFSIYITSNIYNISCDNSKQIVFPPCKACKILVESFLTGMEATEKGKYEGGDTAWEEAKLGSYSTSEIRLTEIQEKLCHELQDGKDQCFSLTEQYDAEIEEWWFKKQKTDPDLEKYLCIDKLKFCCPDLHFGEHCKPCLGYPDNICNGNGKCRGAGTRKGNGTCNCQPGYKGEDCDSCAETYFASYKDKNKLLCSKCHPACDGSCTKAGTKGCEKCVAGWLFVEEKGCVDVNECVSKVSPCSPLQFCVNNDGSYKCLECDRACLGCTGDGPDMCVRCANGYVLINNICIDSDQENRRIQVVYTRYLTYAGLVLATCIILHKNTVLAAIIGVAVGLYISTSEYILNTAPTPKTDNIEEQLLKAFNN